MILYEVNAKVDASEEKNYEQWLHHHIPEVLRLGKFHSARMWKDLDNGEWVIQYLAENQKVLDEYLKHHATALRAAATERFADRFKVRRRVCLFHAEWT